MTIRLEQSIKLKDLSRNYVLGKDQYLSTFSQGHCMHGLFQVYHLKTPKQTGFVLRV